jgi:hypothetical protein
MTAVVLAVLVFSLIAASAASLGGVTTADLGADTEVVASCDEDGVDVDFGTPAYSDTSGVYEVDSVTVSGIADACLGAAIAVTVADVSDASLGEGSGTVVADATDDNTATVSITPADAELVEKVAVVISG